MEKLYAAIGNFYNEEGTQLIDVPADEQEIYAKVEDIMTRNPMSSKLSDEDLAVLRAYLPAIGCDEISQDERFSLQGKGIVTKTAEGCGVAAKATGELDVSSRWELHHDRKQWSGTMKVERLGGEAQVKELTFDFYYMSIGQDVDGNFIVLYNEHYTRSFNDPYHLADFNNGGQAQAIRYDISKHIQWGFYMHVKCSLRTDEGSLVL
jgi:hypothetical protein